ncbi:MAG TPA: FtsW/RodA/SpoVE family cell cycle protein [Thermomicrobiales bacterium]|nr:FtsW/RodA/SpoVE family cell cycle protein [Thermomicrobiales bacterium]
MATIAGLRGAQGRARSTTAQTTELDPFMLVLVAVLTGFGLVTIWSADGAGAITLGSPVIRQGMFAISGVIAMVVLASVNYRFLKSLAPVIYGASIALLLSLMFIGTSILGATRWIYIGPVSFQPSEVAKLGVIIALAAFISEHHDEMDRFQNFLISIAIVGVPFLLVFEQPDLGTSVVFGVVWFVMMLMSSTRLLYLAGVVALAIPGSLFAWRYMLLPYQRDRLMVSYDPYRDYFGEGFNIIQAQVTIGSAGWFGHGLSGGSQSEFQLLSVRTSDFVFAHAMSMFGFVGGIALFFTFMLLLWRILRVVGIARDTFGQQLAVGVAVMIFFQMFVNIGMNLGIMPVTGIPLPFISLGGTSLFVTMSAIGILQSVVMNHRGLGFQSQTRR